jgi:hypothetical protein
MTHPLHSARERLKRANENILNLNSEVNEFLAPFPSIKWTGDTPPVTDANQKSFDVLRKYAQSSDTLPRFSVLAGEIIHHLRCAFNHVIWQLSSDEARVNFGSKIEFPVEVDPPECKLKFTGKVQHSIFCGKVKGVTSLTALARIDELQPYKRRDPNNSPLLFIHDLDRFAKHRELRVVIPEIGMWVQGRGVQPIITVKESATGEVVFRGPAGPPEMEMHAELAAQVTFAEFSERKGDPLIKFLNDLLSFTSNAVESFADEFP